MQPYYFYLARCADGSLYAGSCINLTARQALHNAGKAAKYTRGRRPIQFVYYELFPTRAEACRREAEVKRWPKKRKEMLVLSRRQTAKSLIPLSDSGKPLCKP